VAGWLDHCRGDFPAVQARSKEAESLLEISPLLGTLRGGLVAERAIVMSHGFGVRKEPTGTAAWTPTLLQLVIAEVVVILHLLPAQVTAERLAFGASHLVAAVRLDKWGATGRLWATTSHGLGHGFLSSLIGIGQATLLVGHLQTSLAWMGRLLARDAVLLATWFAKDGRLSLVHDTNVVALRTVPVCCKNTDG
jgi:hypothetical protein